MKIIAARATIKNEIYVKTSVALEVTPVGPKVMPAGIDSDTEINPVSAF